jgi:chromosome segregation protein
MAGAGTRPARNIAEVMLTLDNKSRTAPAMVNDADQLDVVRRIERGHGSAYSVNGREIRARDVQTLFADAATGSRSTALVSQGRVGTLINAKPADRRGIIDEAAGITGLYARRHEAELRLRAAEQNLARVQDVLVALEEQHKGLKRQARQACPTTSAAPRPPCWRCASPRPRPSCRKRASASRKRKPRSPT